MYRKIITTILVALISLSVKYCGTNTDNDNQINSNRSPKYTSNINSNFVLPPPRSEITPRKQAPIRFEIQSREIVEYLRTGNHAQIEVVLNEAIANNYVTRGGFYYPAMILNSAFSDNASYLSQGWLNSLNIWVQRYPNSSYAYTARAIFYYEYGWKIRGSDFANKVPAEAFQEYKEQIRLSYQDIQKALELDPNNLIALEHILNLGVDLSLPPEKFDRYFQQINQQFSYNVQAYRTKTHYLTPKWHGNEQDMLKFAKASVNNAPDQTAIPFILIQAHLELCYLYPQKKTYLNRPEVWQDIETSFNQLFENYPQAGTYMAWFSEVSQDAGKDDLSMKYAKQALKTDPNNVYVRQIAANMGLLN